MNIPKLTFLLLAAYMGLASCGGSKTSEKSPAVDTTKFLVGSDSMVKVDYNEDLTRRSLQDLRLLKGVPYAMKGYCFMEADLRGYFTEHIKSYDSLMNAVYEYQDAHPEAKIELSAQDEGYVMKVDEEIKKRLKNNFIDRNGLPMANVKNIVNLFQFKNPSTEFMSALDKNNFVIVPTDKIQLFHTYEENDYHQVPDFVTTDLYLQLYHMYFSYVLRSLEEHKFIPIITDLADGMHNEATKAAASTADPQVKALAEFTAAFYAVPYYLLTGKKKPVADRYKAMVDREAANINAGGDNESPLLDISHFSYDLFKPRGHYTRSEELKKYFKAMMWLQVAEFCRDSNDQLKRTIFMASLLNNGKDAGGKRLLAVYNSVFEPIVFLIGEPDNLSVNDIAAYLLKNGMSDVGAAVQPQVQGKVDAYLKDLVKTRNRIKPKVEMTCPDKINFMPQRYLFDNEIMQDLVDVRPNAKRSYPKGLDIFAAAGNRAAENILTNEYKEADNWKDYPTELDKLKKKFANYSQWGTTVYNKWIYTLNVMQGRDAAWPSFMKTDSWDRKNLYTALASWAELKHDAILYGEEPAAAECGGGGPPDPITFGYVEPNVSFWKSMTELLAVTHAMLQRNDLLTEDIDNKTKQLNETAQFLLTASQKELRHEKLTEQEYKTIEVIGSSTEYLTLSIMEPDKNFQHWEYVQGPDKSVAVVADVYTRNVPDCNNNGVLHEAVGNVNDIYVVVEIEGYLYLTKGATFSYYEFTQPPATRLTDEEWQKMLDAKRNLPPIPAWMKDIVLPARDLPKVDEKISYSSGC